MGSVKKRNLASCFAAYLNDCGHRLRRNILEVTLRAFVPLSPKFDPRLSLLMPEQDLLGDYGTGPKSSELPMEELF